MTKTRLHSLYLLIAGSVVFLALGFAVETTAKVHLIDYLPIYFAPRALIQHADPYNEQEVMRVYSEEKNEKNSSEAVVKLVATRYLYPPTQFLFTALFALFPWIVACRLWLTLIAGSFLLGAYLFWSTGADFAPVIAGLLTGFYVANSEVLVVLGNAGAVAVGLCIVAVWCLVQDRFALAGILCLAVSLAIKPQDSAMVWLYFLLAGGVYRKRAWQTLLAVIAIGLPGILWVSSVAPNWYQEMQANVRSLFAGGALNDPAVRGRNVAELLVSLQTVSSAFTNNQQIYDAISYLVCAPILFGWMYFVLRSKPSPANAWLALACITPLSLVAVYHHVYDSKILLITIPACALLWAKGGSTAKMALLVSGAALALTGDLSCTVMVFFIRGLHLNATGIWGQAQNALQALPIPLGLLVMSVFYLWALASTRSTTQLLPEDAIAPPAFLSNKHRTPEREY